MASEDPSFHLGYRGAAYQSNRSGDQYRLLFKICFHLGKLSASILTVGVGKEENEVLVAI